MKIRTKNFSLERTLEMGQAFNYSRDEENGHYYVQHAGSVIKVRQAGSALLFETFPKKDDAGMVEDYFQAESDYSAALEKFVEGDKVVALAVSNSPGVRIIQQDPYECIVSYILSQYSSIQRVKQGLGALSRKYGKKFEFDGKTFYSFPKAAALANASEAELRALGLGYRAKYIKNACAQIADGFDLEGVRAMDYQQAREKLMELEGVGEKVADCILLYAYECYEAFPVDTWIRKIMLKHYLGDAKMADKKISDYGRATFGKRAGIVEIHFYASRKQLT